MPLAEKIPPVFRPAGLCKQSCFILNHFVLTSSSTRHPQTLGRYCQVGPLLPQPPTGSAFTRSWIPGIKTSCFRTLVCLRVSITTAHRDRPVTGQKPQKCVWSPFSKPQDFSSPRKMNHCRAATSGLGDCPSGCCRKLSSGVSGFALLPAGIMENAQLSCWACVLEPADSVRPGTNLSRARKVKWTADS